MKNDRGLMIVVSGPSGAGKGTICRALMEQNPEVQMSISATTRKPRPGEVDGVNYFFMDKDAFLEMRDRDGFIEWACFCQNYYGTPKEKVEELLDAGKDVILEIEVQGAMQVRSEYPEAAFVFIVPPSMEELRNRLTGRGTESPEVIEERLKTAMWECTFMERYNYIVVNDQVAQATEDLAAIIQAEKSRTERNSKWIQNFLEN